MPPASNSFTAGKGGALAAKFSATTYYLPVSRFSPQISRGDSIVPVVNNASYDSNRVKGISVCSFDIMMPLIPSIETAAFWTNAFLSVAGDASGTNMWQLSMYPDNDGSTARNYGSCKFNTWAGSINFSANGAAQIAGQRLSGFSIDPEHGTAITAPSSGALSTGGIKGFAQTTITGASAVSSISWQIGTGTGMTPGIVAGGNASYPYLAAGLLQTTIAGSVSVTQSANAGTVLGADGTVGALTVAIGGTGDGISMAFTLMPLSIGKPSDMGLNFMTSTYALISTNGTTAPLVVTDL